MNWKRISLYTVALAATPALINYSGRYILARIDAPIDGWGVILINNLMYVAVFVLFLTFSLYTKEHSWLSVFVLFGLWEVANVLVLVAFISGPNVEGGLMATGFMVLTLMLWHGLVGAFGTATGFFLRRRLQGDKVGLPAY